MPAYPLSSAPELVWALSMLESDRHPDDSQKKRNQHGNEENEPYPAPWTRLRHEIISWDLVVVVGPHGAAYDLPSERSSRGLTFSPGAFRGMGLGLM